MWGVELLVLAVSKEQWNGPPDAPICTNLAKQWRDNFGHEERAYMMQSQSYTCRGENTDCMTGNDAGDFEPKYTFICMSKGPGGKGSTLIQDPAPDYTIIGATTEFHSHKPCMLLEQLMHLDGIDPGKGDEGEGKGNCEECLPYLHCLNPEQEDDQCQHAPSWCHDCEPPQKAGGNRRRTEAASGEFGSGMNAGSGEVGNGEVCETVNQEVCAYPPMPNGLQAMPHLPDGELTKWGGLLLNVIANQEDQAPGWPASETISHHPIYGVDGTACQLMEEHEGRERGFYDGGVVVEKTFGSYMTTRAFMFKNDADREVAMQDERNKGLKYAKTFTGENGCDTEVVWELKPLAGGGLEMEVTVPLDATTCEGEQALRNAIVVYFTGDEVCISTRMHAFRP